MRSPVDAVWPGQPYPRGATWDGMGVNFAMFSESAERVELCLFDASGRHELQRVWTQTRTNLRDFKWGQLRPWQLAKAMVQDFSLTTSFASSFREFSRQ